MTHTRVRWLALAVALALGAGLRADALSTGFYTDDYEQLAMLRGQFVLQHPAWDTFWFSARTDTERQRLLDFGSTPWWTAPDHRIAMLRPLSSGLSWLDDRLFGDAAWLYHLHSFVWWGLLITAAWALLFRVLPPPAAALALLLFALDEAHDVPLSWIANRSSLVAACLGLWALLAQLHAQERGAPKRLWLAGLGFAAALAAGEYAFGVLGYALALAAFGPAGTRRTRVTAIRAAAIPALAYLAARAVLGHGVVSSGLYVSPSDPLRYLAIAPARWLALAGDLVLGLPAQQLWQGSPLNGRLASLGLFTPAQWHRLPDWRSLHLVLGALALGLAALALRWLAARRAPELPALRWLLVGGALGLLSAGSALPESRLLIAPALGVSAALAVVVVHAAAALRRQRRLVFAAAIAAIAFVHGVDAARAARADARGRKARAAATREMALGAQIPRDARGIDVVIVSAGDFSAASALPWIRRLHGLPLPRSYRRLSGYSGGHVLQRIDDRTLQLETVGPSRGAFAGSLYRAERPRLHPGERLHLRGMEVQVLGVRDGDVASWVVRFDRPLESPSLLWLHAVRGGLRRFRPPPPGELMVLPRPMAAWE